MQLPCSSAQQMQQAAADPAKFPVKLLHSNKLSSRAWRVGFGAEPNLVRDALSIVVDFFSFSSSPIQGADLGYLDQGKFMAVPPGEEWREFLQESQQASVQEGCLVLCMNGPANREIFSKFVADRFVPLVATSVGTLEEPDDLPTAQFSGGLSGLLTQFQGLSCALPKLDLPQNTASESSANHRRIAPHGVGWFPLHLDKPGFAQAVVQFVNNADDTEHRSQHGEQGASEGAKDCKEKSASQHPATLQAWHVVDLEDLQLHKVLGRGASGVVVTGTVQGVAAAVKVFPEDWLEEAQHEANVYHALHHLWGTYIPKLLLTGLVAMYGWPFLALQQIPGQRLSAMGTLSDEVQRAAVRALSAVHDSGVLHGDIRLDNLLCVTLTSDQQGPCTTLTTSPCTPPNFSLVDMECSPREAVSGRTEADCTTRPASWETVCTSNSDSVSPASMVSSDDAAEGGLVCVFVVDFGRAEVGACPAALAFEMADLRSQLKWCNSPT